MTEEVTNPDLRSQDERQLDLIRDLNSRVPSNPQGDAADAGLKKSSNPSIKIPSAMLFAILFLQIN